MRWGLVPPWQKGDKNPRGFINARAETLAVRRAFLEPLRRYRCLVPADGFYEWQRQGARRQAWFFFRRDRRPFVFAGIYTPGSGEERELDGTMAIVTCAPNPLVSPIHDRMPVVLDEDLRRAWLDEGAAIDELLRRLRPFPAEEMAGHPVSAAVNSASVEGPDLIRPLPQGELQFHQ
jgi:putative SOS response-associated peptidase YedK